MRPGIVAYVQREVSTAARRLATGIVRRGLVALASADGFLQVDGYSDETFDEVEHWQGYGLASRPKAGSEVIVLRAGVSGQTAIAVSGTDRANRPTDLDEGEVALYGDGGSTQPTVRLAPSGNIDLSTPATGATVNVGGDAQSILLGDTVNAHMLAFAQALKASLTVANVAAAGLALETAINTGWKATKGKVS